MQAITFLIHSLFFFFPPFLLFFVNELFDKRRIVYIMRIDLVLELVCLSLFFCPISTLSFWGILQLELKPFLMRNTWDLFLTVPIKRKIAYYQWYRFKSPLQTNFPVRMTNRLQAQIFDCSSTYIIKKSEKFFSRLLYI